MRNGPLETDQVIRPPLQAKKTLQKMLAPIGKIMRSLESVSARVPRWVDAMTSIVTMFNMMDLAVSVFFTTGAKDPVAVDVLKGVGGMSSEIVTSFKYDFASGSHLFLNPAPLLSFWLA